MKCDKKDLLLYAVTYSRWTGRQTLYEQVEEAIKGGITFLQLREKDLDEGSFLKEAEKMRDLCRKNQIPFIINDNVDIALKTGADGVHVGQEDMEAQDVRKILGEDKIIGVSARTVEQAVKAQQQGADYLGVGSVFTTGTKLDAGHVSYGTLKEICRSVTIPVIAIGGITKENVKELSGSGICGVAVVSALFAQEDIRKAAADLKTEVEKAVSL